MTIEVIEVVGKIIQKHSGMLCIASCGGVAGIFWSFLCSTVFIGVWASADRGSATTPQNALGPQQEGDGGSRNDKSPIGYIQYFFECIIYFWGALVAYNVCHVAFCGVFGRWYFGKEMESGNVRGSLKNALT